MTYQLPEPALPNCVIGQDSTMRTVRLDCYTADQMQSAWQAGRDSDTALLRQCLEGYESITARKPERIEKLVTALRERLGAKA